MNRSTATVVLTSLVAAGVITGVVLTTNGDEITSVTRDNYIISPGGNKVIVVSPELSASEEDKEVPYIESIQCNIVALLKQCPENTDCVKLPEVCEGDLCFFNILGVGKDCKEFADIDGYLGSSIDQFDSLDAKYKKKLLKKMGTCTDKDTGKKYDCLVSYDDPSAKTNEAFIPHSWLGRKDLNFKKVDTSLSPVEP